MRQGGLELLMFEWDRLEGGREGRGVVVVGSGCGGGGEWGGVVEVVLVVWLWFVVMMTRTMGKIHG